MTDIKEIKSDQMRLLESQRSHDQLDFGKGNGGLMDSVRPQTPESNPDPACFFFFFNPIKFGILALPDPGTLTIQTARQENKLLQKKKKSL